MVKSLATILLCTVALFASGQAFTDADLAWKGTLATPPAAGGGACETSDTTLPHSLLLEGFETPGYENSWAETGTVDDQSDTSALTSNKPVGACDVGFSVSVSGSAKYAQYDFGSNQTQPVDVHCYIYPTGVTDDTGFSILTFGDISTPGASSSTILNFRRASGAYEVRVIGSDATGYNAITADAWNKIQIHIASGAAASYLKINDGSEITFTAVANSTRWLAVGQTSVQSGVAGTFYFDLVAVD